MKKIITLAAILVFTIQTNAQEATKKAKCSTKQEMSCCKKTMTAEEISKCQAKCKAEGKTCEATTRKKTKKCCAKESK
ncbi:hypothetical protein [Flavobacterium crassostreae]|uniref:Uncharacterized protein n=1 Tax=Flavobacterium crassostreae TaxID=1763534 RepID=A0A1B9E3J1_9FLAO|nr:hypothetical protein [Flavobacterium crassostreae]OCB76468.1 hypothetical protein LPBF_05885 [Flavobacterium crassostreae]